MRNDFEKAMHFRHACKLFDETKKMSQEDLDFILEAGRMSPSSCGMEQWKFVVIRDEKLKEAIRPIAWNQPQITTCSELVAILYKKQMRSTTPYIKGQYKKLFGADEVADWYRDFIDPMSDETLECWAMQQCHIAAANMMTAAAYIGIDSCPIGGYDKAALESVLPIDKQLYGVALMIPFGYRAKEQQTRLRSDIKELVEYIN
ncbi:MAG: NAD(P)H-dependent oxidoreductase [Campylobacterales bacterium]